VTFTTPSPDSQWGATPSGAPAGWHADPWGVAPWRWWDGYQWTAHVWPPSAPQRAKREFRSAFWPSVGWMLLSMVAGIAAGVPPAVVLVLLGAGQTGAITSFAIVFYPVMFLGFWLASRKLSREYGTASMCADYGWMKFRWVDLGWGLLAAVAALVAQLVIGLVFQQPDDGSYRDAVFGKDPNVLLVVGMSVAIVVGAPLFEELMFRGPIMRSLIARFGTWPGLILQGGVFALYHVVGNPTLITAWYLTPLFAVGVILGIAAHRTGRMATSQIAHAAMNTVALVALLMSL
jgi:hypothetical protein